MEPILLRSAKVGDCQGIFNLIKENARVEKLIDDLSVTVEDLVRDGFTSNPPIFHCLVAIQNNDIVGMGLFYPVYSTWQGKCMHLGNLLVKPTYPHQTIASQLLKAIIQISINDGCARFDIEVAAQCQIRELLEKNGMRDVTISENWHQYKLSKKQMTIIANNTTNKSI